MKGKILIACVNFNTQEKLSLYLESIKDAVIECAIPIEVDIVIGDNSSNFKRIEKFTARSINLHHVNNNQNLGYIGGIKKAISESKILLQDYTYFIISNVDLQIDKSFFNTLNKIRNTNKIGWIAPCIISEKEKRDRNPKILERPSFKKMSITKTFYKYPILHFIYEKLFYTNKSKKLTSSNNAEIYAGHGSFMIFTQALSTTPNFLNFPSYLFGEEIYFGEICRLSGLKTIYCPELKIYDFDHVNTSKIKRSSYYNMNLESIRILSEKYFQ